MTARMLKLVVRDELLAITREPTALFFTVAMPVAFYTMFVAMFGSTGPEPPTAAMLTPFGAFGVLRGGDDESGDGPRRRPGERMVAGETTTTGRER